MKESLKGEIKRLWDLSTRTIHEKLERDGTLIELIDMRVQLNLEIDKDEAYWEQKARANWLQLGDKNTSFFIDLLLFIKGKILFAGWSVRVVQKPTMRRKKGR